MLVIGAAAGLLLGTAFETLNPMLTMPEATFAAVGMGSLFVAVVGRP